MKIRSAALLLLLVGCRGGGTDPDDWQQRLGVVDPQLSAAQTIELPQVVSAGALFPVVVRTIGSSSCTRVARTDVSVNGLLAEIRPYDSYAPARSACTDDLHFFVHETMLRFTTRGTARVVLHGRRYTGEPTRVEVSLEVR